VAKVYSKIYDRDLHVLARYLEQSLAEYHKIKLFIDEYAIMQKITINKLQPEYLEKYKYVKE
jgi:uncharacterized protein VirK/YbjX